MEYVRAPKKLKLKVTKDTIILRLDSDEKNKKSSGELAKYWKAKLIHQRTPEPLRKTIKKPFRPKTPFSFKELADIFGVSYKTAWRWYDDEEELVPTKTKCPHCGVSQYMRVSKWINDGTLDHILKGVAK